MKEGKDKGGKEGEEEGRRKEWRWMVGWRERGWECAAIHAIYNVNFSSQEEEADSSRKEAVYTP